MGQVPLLAKVAAMTALLSQVISNDDILKKKIAIFNVLYGNLLLYLLLPENRTQVFS